MLGLGAFIGDYSGSKYEFNPYIGEYDDIDVRGEGIRYTDDSVMTTAVMEWLICTGVDNKKKDISEFYKMYGRKFPNAGYGHLFHDWLFSDSSSPYGSYGNGSGMRVSPVGFYAKSLQECLDLAKETAMPTHNHEEGIKGAQAIAACIYLARIGSTKDEIKKAISHYFSYDLDRTVDEIRGTHKFDATCQVTVPEAIICFLESNSIYECVKKALWVGVDVDTIGAMACPIAEAYFGVPCYLQEKMYGMLTEDMKERVMVFNRLLVNDSSLK
jgi:ADP-ribosylglycohydrolase